MKQKAGSESSRSKVARLASVAGLVMLLTPPPLCIGGDGCRRSGFPTCTSRRWPKASTRPVHPSAPSAQPHGESSPIARVEQVCGMDETARLESWLSPRERRQMPVWHLWYNMRETAGTLSDVIAEA